jgi:tetratricopeptide (TPR) repeat protein
MHTARTWIATGLFFLCAGAGATLAPPALAQESVLDQARAAARSGDPRASLAYARALRRAGRDTEAAQELRPRVAQTPGGALGVELRWELARVAIARHEFQQAMAHCRSAGAIAGGATAGHACAAEAHLLWRRASEALLETAQALKGGTKSYEAKVAEGSAHELQLEDDAAEASFREAVAWRPDAWEGHVSLGRLLVHRGKRDEGTGELKRAIQLDPHGPEAQYELALTLPASAESATLLEGAIRERPSYVPALRKLAEVDMSLGRKDEARKAAEVALKADPRDAASHLIMGRVALGEGNADDAIREGQAALAILANSAGGKLLIADAYAKKGEIDLAVESYQAAFGFDHADPAPLVRASEACRAAGRDTSAKAFGEKASREFPEWAPAWVALGDALVANKEIGSARVAYETALKSKGPLDAAAVQRKMAALR